MAAAAMVLALTAASGALGPHDSGLLAPFPIITSVLAAFSHAQRGSEEALALLRGMLLGFFGFALFCATVAVGLPYLGITATFVLATAAALIVQGLLLWSPLSRRALPLRHRQPTAP